MLKLKPLSVEAGLSMGALAVAWTLQNDNVASAIIGASRPEQVVDNAAGAGCGWTPNCCTESTTSSAT